MPITMVFDCLITIYHLALSYLSFVAAALMVYILTTGMAPASSPVITLLELFFGGIVRIVSLFYLKSFNSICAEEHAKRNSSKSK
jgi:hypothetical protein